MSQLVMKRDAVTGVVRYHQPSNDLGLYYEFEQNPNDPFDCVESIETSEE